MSYELEGACLSMFSSKITLAEADLLAATALFLFHRRISNRASVEVIVYKASVEIQIQPFA